MTQNLIETFKAIIYNQKHTKNTKLYYNLFKIKKINKSRFRIFQNCKSKKKEKKRVVC